MRPRRRHEMSRFEARLRVTVLLVVALVSSMMLIGQAGQTRAQAAVTPVPSATARLVVVAAGEACQRR